MKFTEAQLESAIIELLGAEGYPHVLGEAIERQPQEVLIKADLRNFLHRQYASDGITSGEIELIIKQLEGHSAGALYESNKAIMRLVTDGFFFKRERLGSSPTGRSGDEGRSQRDLYIQLIDYSDLPAYHIPEAGEVGRLGEDAATYHCGSNIFKIVNQLEIYGSEKRIPDGILYINGLPLVVFEFKSAIREEATIHDAYTQLTVRYQRDIPELFKFNAFCVISDGANSRVGSFFANYEFWYPWRVASHNPHPQPLSQREKGVNYRGGFEYASLAKRVRELREQQTPAEAAFWELAKNRQINGLKFRRQHQIADYIVDFYCHEFKIVVEFDGAVHDSQRMVKHDKKRDAYLKSLGCKVLRFPNEDVFENTEKVIQQIVSTSQKLPSTSQKLPSTSQKLPSTSQKLPSTSGRGAGGEGVSDSGVSDSGVSDSGVSDSGVSDSGVSDSGVSDSGVSDSGASKAAEGIGSLYSMINGLFDKRTLLDVIRNFIHFPDVSRSETKILCRYPQYYAAKKLYQNILQHMRPLGDGKGGTYFGATGCGKSYTMLFLSRLLMKSVALKSPTIVLITDRTDLDDQLSGQFTNGKTYIGDQSVISVESREHLRELMQGRKSGGVFLTTIHKFTEDTQLLTDRSNVICISDEAHRSQINLDQKLRVTEDGMKRTFGFAKYLHDSLPNATYVGFTGTPIDATLDVFGEVVDSYTMTESVADEITVRIVYEGRAAKVLLDNRKLQEIEKYYEECAVAGASDYAIEESKKANANMGAILGDPDRIKALAADFVTHYETRVGEGSTVLGKAMFVSSKREIAYNFYKEVIALLGERSSRCVTLSDFIDVGLTEKDGAGAPSLPASSLLGSLTRSFGAPEEWHTRNLPHRDKAGLIQSITFRLADSMPAEVLEKMKGELANLPDEQRKQELRKKQQFYLDQGAGCCALNNPEMAECVINALRHHDGEKYRLLAWSIMPNHVHVLIQANHDLANILQSWKSYTGKWASKNNRRLQLGIPLEQKSFWQAEYWDRFIRNESHFNRTLDYILRNPASAGLDERATAHLYTGNSANVRTEQELRYSQLHPSQIKMVMTRGKDDPKELYDLVGTKDDRKELDRQFKNAKSNFKIAIVVDMWLTGFDVPFLDTIYIDKPIQRHNLIQTISRVNRKYGDKEKGLVVDYIGIKKQMNLALAQYSKADEQNIEEIQQSIIVVKDHLDLLGRLFHKFDSSPYFSGSPIEQLHCLNQASEFAQLTEKIEKRFMGLVKRLKAAYDICSGSGAFSQLERDTVHFFLAVRSIVYKLTKGDAPDTARMNAKVRDMIAAALQADGVEEIFKLGEDGATEIDIFEDDYLAKIEKIKLPNTKIKLLQKLLKKAIDDFKKVNRIKGVDFSKKFQDIVQKYNERDEADVLRSEVLDGFSDEIINLIGALKTEMESFTELGIDIEEKSFYDILKELAHKYDFAYPEDKLLHLAKEVKKVVDDKAKYTDWNQRNDIKAELKVELIILLAENDYPPVDRDEVYKEIFEQAENFKKYQGGAA